MPNRMLRDWTDSEKVNSLSVNAECFFTRLIMKVDDYGCFPADPRLLKANLYPLKLDVVREADISRFLAEAQKAGLIALYEATNKQFLQIQDFKQRLDKAKAKYPLPPSQSSLPTSGNPLTTSTESMSEAEVETEVEKESIVVGDSSPPASEKMKKAKPREVQQQQLLQRQAVFRKELEAYESFYGTGIVDAFYEYWSEETRSKTKMLWETLKSWNTKKRLDRWRNNESKFDGKKRSSGAETDTSSAASEFIKNLNKDTVKK